MGKSLEELEAAFRKQYPKKAKQENEQQVEPKEHAKESRRTTEARDFKHIPVRNEVKEPQRVKGFQDIQVGNTAKEEQKVRSFRDIPMRNEVKKPQRAKSFSNILSKFPQMEKNSGKACTPRAFMISEIIFYVSLVAIILCTVLFSGGLLGDRAVGGRRFVEMSTASMASVYSKGSLLVVEEVPASELQVGDDISFVKDALVSVTQRIIEIEEPEEDGEEVGKRVFITQGVADASDKEEVLEGNVIGRVSSSIAGLGTVLSLATRNLNIIIGVFIAFMVASFAIKLFWRESK